MTEPFSPRDRTSSRKSRAAGAHLAYPSAVFAKGYSDGRNFLAFSAALADCDDLRICHSCVPVSLAAWWLMTENIKRVAAVFGGCEIFKILKATIAFVAVLMVHLMLWARRSEECVSNQLVDWSIGLFACWQHQCHAWITTPHRRTEDCAKMALAAYRVRHNDTDSTVVGYLVSAVRFDDWQPAFGGFHAAGLGV